MAKIRSHKIRSAILKEYNHCCAACGCADREALAIDHVVPQSLGGSDELDNLQVLCVVCNSQIKGKVQTPRLDPRQPIWDCRKWKKGRMELRAMINGMKG